jgi:hypothetical protein
MKTIEKILYQLKNDPYNARFSDLCKLCEYYFGPPRKSGGSHMIFKTPWPGDPRIIIQNKKEMAKAYQIKQVLMAIERMELINGEKK